MFQWPARSAIAQGVPSFVSRLRSLTPSGTLDLTETNPTRAGVDYGCYGPPHTWGLDCWQAYAPDSFGARNVREKIAELSGRVPPSQIALCASSSEAYHFLLTLLCDPGDGVLIPEPSYPLFEHLARYAGVEAQFYRLEYDGRWHIDLDSLRRARTKRSRLVFVVNPNNPTGSSLSIDERRALRQLGLPIVADEVFAGYPLQAPESRIASLLEGTQEGLTFVLDGLSKSCGLPQAKLSWVSFEGGRRQVSEVTHRLGFILDTFLTVSSFVQAAAPHLLDRGGAFRQGLLARLRGNLDTLHKAMRDLPATVLHCEGGWTAIVRLPDVLDPATDASSLGDPAEEAWVLAFLQQSGVLVWPGYLFDVTKGPHVVASLLPPPDVFATAALRMRELIIRNAVDVCHRQQCPGDQRQS